MILQACWARSPGDGGALYVAVSTDTGCFVYGNTTADTHRTAAALMETGIPAAELNKRHFRTKTLKRLRIEPDRGGMELFDGGETAVAAWTWRWWPSWGADEAGPGGYRLLCGTGGGVKNAITIRELEGPGRASCPCALIRRSLAPAGYAPWEARATPPPQHRWRGSVEGQANPPVGDRAGAWLTASSSSKAPRWTSMDVCQAERGSSTKGASATPFYWTPWRQVCSRVRGPGYPGRWSLPPSPEKSM